MSCGSEYAPQLRARGFRVTPQRLAVLHVLRHARDHLSASEVFREAKRQYPRITGPTVYRTLDFLSQNGLVRPSQSRNGRRTFQFAGNDHHHVICRNCGSETELEHHVLEGLYRTLESATGYLRINSHMTFVGVCPQCQ